MTIDILRHYALAGLFLYSLFSCQPTVAAGPFAKGNAFYRAGDYDSAVLAYSEAIRLEPHNAIAYEARGLVYDKKGQREKAIQDYTEAIRIDPKRGSSYELRGSVRRLQGKLGEAIADHTEAIRLGMTLKDVALAHLGRGDAHQDKQELKKAIEDYTEAISLETEGAVAALRADRTRASLRGHGRMGKSDRGPDTID